MTLRAVGVVVGAFLCTVSVAARQPTAPKLDRAQRELLQSIVAAVDAAAGQTDASASDWQTHVLRTSDGAHYVAFTVGTSALDRPEPKSTVYVRLASRPDPALGPAVERSAVMEWLKGMRSDPLVAQKQRGVAFGEMPAYGAAALSSRGLGQQAADLRVLGLQQERDRERRETAEKQRKADLEGTGGARARNALYPFEDFAVETQIAATDPAGTPVVRRSLTAGPGDYDLFVAWGSPAAKGRTPVVHVKRQRLRLAPATTTDLMLSSVIVAEQLVTRDTPVAPDRQTSHPYAIGPLEIVPARHEAFTNDQRLAIVFQVINASANDTGKPDVAVGFQLFRVSPSGEQSLGLLNPQFYNAATLPADFSLAQGHPLFVAMAAPLKSLARGDYRLRIEATDKLLQRSARAELPFRVIATPQTLLATAPGAPPFRREALLTEPVLREAVAALRPAQPTAAMATALAAAEQARFMELLRDDATSVEERAARAALKAMGLYALGDARIACSMLQQSFDLAPNGATLLYLGACRAIERNDRDAIAAWQAALDNNLAPEVVVPLLVNAHLRAGEPTRAIEIAQRVTADGAPAASMVPGLAAAHLAQGRIGEAISLLDAHVTSQPEDRDAQYVLLHALFTEFVRGQGSGATRDGQDRFRALARIYIDRKGDNAAVVGEWLEIVR